MKKVLIIVLGAVLFGGGIAWFMFNKIVLTEDIISEDVVTAFQVGAFTNYENALRVAERNNGIVVSDEDIFRVYVAILYDDNAISKLMDYYDEIGLNYYLKKIRVSNDFIESISNSEELLIKSSSDTYTVINLGVLERYKEML